MQRDPGKEEAGLIRWCLSSIAGCILEIGCGNGRLTADLARLADSLVAVDSYMQELKSARRRVDNSVKFVAALGESLPLTANSIDAVAFTLSLHHQEPHKALREASRVLKEDGKILVLEPVADSIINKLFSVLDDESDKFEMVERAIDGSELKVIHSGFVKTRWVFDHFAEMACYLFDYFGLKPDRDKENLMEQILGDRRGLEPLPIEDITRFWLLSMR